MALPIGSRLGSYEVTALIGAGGMGEVYRARDTKLHRDVALKILPEAFALDPDRLARFEREAQLLATLNHPNIAAIYGFEEANNIQALVLELVDGPTLDHRIALGPIPLDEALPIARQIAEALEAAHEHGIIHRDLKPANIKVRADGTVKVLDFGLAKALDPPPATAADVTGSPTTTSPAMTRMGVILGTAAYMAPEQAKGMTVDRRADIWAFGAVLFEMLAGKRLFGGDTAAETLASVMKEVPSFGLLPSDTPPVIRNLLRRCVERDLRRRLAHIAEARMIIEDGLAGATLAEPAEVEVVRAAKHRAIVVGVGCLLTGSLLMGLLAWSLRPAPLLPVSRMVIPLPPNEQLRGAVAPMLALSPDGARLAYIAGAGAQGRIYLRALDSMEARPIAGTEGALDPFFSPDGQWIGFFAAGKLKKVSTSGGAVLTLCDAPDPFGATWGANDTIAFASTGRTGLFVVSAAGGEPQPLTHLEEIENGHRWPHFLPDGKTILYTSGVGAAIATFDEGHIAAHRLDTGEQRVLLRGGTFPRYVPIGQLVYYRAGTIMGARFDTDRLEVGMPAPIVEDVMSSAGAAGGRGAAQFSFSALGSLVYLRGGPQSGQRTLVWVDREGTEVPLPAPRRSYDDLSLSPDGRQVAVQILEPPPASVWIYDIPRSTLTRLTSEGVANLPVWTPDGKRIVFAVSTPGANGLFWKPTDGSGPEERVMTSELPPGPTSVSPDGQTLAFYATTAGTGADLWVVPLHGDRKPRPFLQTPFFEVDPMFSPDGRWLAYTSGESGRSEVYVQPYPGPGGKWLISTEGGAEPLWSPSGRELFYRNDDRMMAVDIQTQPAFKAGTPRMLFDKPGYFGGAGADHDISPDGQRFLMIKETEQQETALTQINVVLNWFEELKRRVPAN